MKNYRSEQTTETIIGAGLMLIIIMLAIYTAINVNAFVQLEQNVYMSLVLK
jgi:hypothetical protein